MSDQPSATTGPLVLHVCAACATAQLFPRTRCPQCGGPEFIDRPASGAATLVSWSVVRRAPSEAFAPDLPYTVALVRLAEGPQMMTRIVDAAAPALHEGLPLRMRLATIAGREGLAVFAPEGSGS